MSDVKGKNCTVLCHHHLAWGLWWHTVLCLRPPSGVNDLQSVNQRQSASTSSPTSSSSNSHQHHKKSIINALGEHDHRLSQDWRMLSSPSMSCTSCHHFLSLGWWANVIQNIDNEMYKEFQFKVPKYSLAQTGWQGQGFIKEDIYLVSQIFQWASISALLTQTRWTNS